MGQTVFGDNPNMPARSIWLLATNLNRNNPTFIIIRILIASVKVLGLKERLPCSD
jgi:hypothetical protein